MRYIILGKDDTLPGMPCSVCAQKTGNDGGPNEKNELVPMRTVIGWIVFMDYGKFYAQTEKDHFSMTFMF